MVSGKQVLLIIGGGIAAYKALELVRLLRKRGIAVRAVLTKAGEEFVTPLSLSALTEDKIYTDLFSLTDEAEMGHIQLSRSADLILVAPATADMLAKMRAGLAGDLASTLLLATDTPVLAAPAMNIRMWTHAATQENVTVLAERGISFIGPEEGDMACGEFGPGRMAEPAAIAEAVAVRLDPAPKPLAGKCAIVTSGPTYEPIDPVRYIANRSSGKQGHAIAAALAAAGAKVTLVTGPTREPDPAGVTVRHIETARQMLAGVEAALPANIAIFAAAVADWRVAEEATQKLKKESSGNIPALSMIENPDILKTVSRLDKNRPALVIGFAAETENLIAHGTEKRTRKGCDWVLANDVSPVTGTFGGDVNTIHLITGDGAEVWPTLTKKEVATRLAARITEHFRA